ncbi:unknown protein [Oryza sativa Japonica Group]|uniref:Os01g0189800 protein n=2 Tax=Oryza sativa subsp. japonica TaxID=39947 RepID=A0A5S6R970_ORYSJ|nr:uncharacterized protein LOC4326773 [Oryza sativa Japonica Group]KAB8080304.1 hypothetical protein EE612_000741 [Oryza sativa]BAD72215.1 unknown protein [Oryza sativa Japonica Group]BAF04175.2 Os01g0189800 [Oryza sativa Japonica Group]BAS70813.1 Os01g0189800 [Oryza sativa Japonica Group]|eukprot:NP_001042261.2 Os01g0189800 [Oryza sativa Japonica Group]
MRIPTTETETGTGTRSHRRRKGSSDGSRAVHRTDASRRGPTPTKETEIPGRPPKRSSLTLSLDDAGASNPASTWAILNRYGARRDSFRGDDRDRTTSAVSYTSGGDQISVSFELVKPPETSLLTLDWPQGPRPSAGTTSYPYVIAAHDNVVLFQIISPDKYARPSAIDYFVYNANSSSSSNHHPSLTRLPVSYWRRRDTLRPRIMSREGTCILSCSNNSPSFVVAELERRSCQSSETNIYLFASGSDDWRVFRNVPIRHGDGLAHLCWWTTDAVLSYHNRYMIWVDYLVAGMIVAKVAHPGRVDPPEPVLWYVPLPVDPVDGNPYDIDRGRGCPQASRSVCATHHGIKFVNVNQHGGGSSSSSSSSRSFSITLWSWREEDQTWGEDATLDADQLRDLDSENRLPNIQPEFPVVDMENPYAVCFLLNERYHTADPNATTWMIKVHMKKKVLLDCTGYSNKGSPSTARRMSEGLSFISSEMPSYLSRKTIKRQEVDKLGI